MLVLKLHRKYLLRLAFAFGFSVVCLLLAIPPSRQTSIGAFLMFAQGGALYTPGAYPPSLIFGSLPFLVFCYLFAGFLKEDLGRAAAYIFTRRKRRSQWLMKKMALLFLATLVFYLAVFLTLTCAHMLITTEKNLIEYWKNALVLLMPLVALNSVFTCVFLALINLLALRFDPLRPFLVIAFVHLFGLFAFIALPGEAQGIVARALPSAQGVFAWHDIAAFLDADAYGLLEGCMIKGFSLAYSYTYLIALGAIEALTGLFLINRTDLM